MSNVRRTAPIAALAVLLPACAAQRLPLPSLSADPPPIRSDLTHVDLRVGDVQVTHLRSGRDYERVPDLRSAFIRHLNSRAYFGRFENAERPVPAAATSEPLSTVKVRLAIEPDQDKHRTYVLDAVAAFPFCGLFPVTPEWGDATVRVAVRLEREKEAEESFEILAKVPYSVVFYSWYRTKEKEDAFERAYEVALERTAERIVEALTRDHLSYLRAHDRDEPADESSIASLGPSSSATIADVSPEPSVDSSTVGATPIVAMVRAAPPLPEIPIRGPPFEEIWLPEHGFRLIARPVVRAKKPGLFTRYLGALGGLEGAITGGVANVQSSARSESGASELVGSGEAVTSGYRLIFFRPPDRSGWFFPPVFGFFSQDITIRGFREDIPLFNPAGSQTFSAKASDPQTGALIDISEPLAYFLRLRSAFVGQGIGLNLVLGTDDVQFFTTLRLGLNVFEVRHTDVTLYQTREKGFSAAFLQSGQAGAQLGVTIPAIHLSIRGVAELEYFREFSYPEPIEFQASVVFNESKQIYERQRVFVDGAELWTFNWQIAAAVLF